jgi:putative transposase
MLEYVSPDRAFRWAVVSQVLSRLARGQSLAEAVHAVARQEHHDLCGGSPRKVSERSIYRWFASYKEEGLCGLETGARSVDPVISTVLPAPFITLLVNHKTQDPRVSIPEIIRRAREYGILKPDDAIDRTTVYRTAKRLGLAVARRKKKSGRDSRRFAYPHRLDMVLSDGKHFRAGPTRARRVAKFFLDDSTRLGLHVVVGTSENAALFQRGLYETILKYGLFVAIYVDRGPGFIAGDTAAVIENLGSLLILGEKGYPEGHGKIEKFNQTAEADVLRGLDRRPDVDPDPSALELRLQHYLESQYNQRPHESLRGHSPYERFSSDEKPLRFPEDQEELRRKFEVHLIRRVSPDHVVSVDSVHYEMPRGYDGSKVLLHRKLLEPGGIFFLHQGRLIELHAVDLHANARSRRAKPRSDESQPDHPLPRSAADLAYERDFGPVVDPDGGYSDSNTSNPEEVQ